MQCKGFLVKYATNNTTYADIQIHSGSWSHHADMSSIRTQKLESPVTKIYTPSKYFPVWSRYPWGDRISWWEQNILSRWADSSNFNTNCIKCSKKPAESKTWSLYPHKVYGYWTMEAMERSDNLLISLYYVLIIFSLSLDAEKTRQFMNSLMRYAKF